MRVLMLHCAGFLGRAQRPSCLQKGLQPSQQQAHTRLWGEERIGKGHTELPRVRAAIIAARVTLEVGSCASMFHAARVCPTVAIGPAGAPSGVAAIACFR